MFISLTLNLKPNSILTQNLTAKTWLLGFLDEAGETTEPESMIPIGLLAAQIILAGDPKQVTKERKKERLATLLEGAGWKKLKCIAKIF